MRVFGLFGLLIALLLGVMLLLRPDIFSGTSGSATSTTPINAVHTIDAAKNARDLIQNQYKAETELE